MAETAVNLVIEEAYLLRGIHKEVEEIWCDLDYIQAFPKDADVRAQINKITNSSQGVKK